MPGSPIVFFILAAVAIATAVGMLVSRNAIYSALFLVLNFLTVAVMYLVLGAPFIALSQITVYAGSIMVLFLFVIMLLGAERLQRSEKLRWQPMLAIPLALILAGVLALNLFGRVGVLQPTAEVADTFGEPAAIGGALFTQYVLPFLTTGLILLVATVGAVILAKPDRKTSPGQVVRHVNAAVPAPAGAPGSTEKEMPAAEQEKVA
jgi:NADH-quinone oxidoreductase subunit J